jgi:hypothetical protein
MTTAPVRCALCSRGMDSWYYGMRAPMCAWCRDKSGPVRDPAQWEIDARHCSPAARRLWESWALKPRAVTWPDLPAATTGFSVFRELSDGRGRQYAGVQFNRGRAGAEWFLRQLRIFGVQPSADAPAYALLDAVDADGELLGVTYDLPTREAFAYVYRKLGLRVTYSGGEGDREQAAAMGGRLPLRG